MVAILKREAWNKGRSSTRTHRLPRLKVEWQVTDTLPTETGWHANGRFGRVAVREQPCRATAPIRYLPLMWLRVELRLRAFNCHLPCAAQEGEESATDHGFLIVHENPGVKGGNDNLPS